MPIQLNSSQPIVELIKEDKPFKEKYSYGKVEHNFIYFGVKTNRFEAENCVLNLRRKHQNHPSYKRNDKNGSNQTLDMINAKYNKQSV